jgi:RNA polymerase sigma factor for flagellar operon FliA
MFTCHDIDCLWTTYRETRSQEARNILVEFYMPLVHKRASLLIGRLPACVGEDDLCSAGYEGLIQAVEAFDDGRNVAFEAFCQKRILGAMCDWLRQVSPHSRTVQAFLTRSNGVRNTLSMTNGRRAIDEEVADQMGMRQSRFNNLSRIAKNEEEIQLSVLQRRTDVGYRGDSGELSWEVVDSREADPASKTARELLLQSITSDLSREEQLILTLYYYEGLTMERIGAVLDVSESRVSQMHTLLLEHLRAQLARNPENPPPADRRSPNYTRHHTQHPAFVPAEAAA